MLSLVFDFIFASWRQVTPNFFTLDLVDIIMKSFLLFENCILMRILLGLKIKSKLFQLILKLAKLNLHRLLLPSLLFHDLHMLASLVLHILKNLSILLLSQMQPLISIISKLFN